MNTNISNAELELMNVLWHEHPLTVGQLIERVRHTNKWHDNTIKTMLNRLVRKDVVLRNKDGGRFFYQPAITQAAYLTQESQGLLAKFFDGKMAPLVAHLASQNKLSKQDVADIRTILKNIGDQDDA